MRSAPRIRFTPRARSIGHSSTTSRRYLQCDLRARSVLALARERLGRDSPRPRSIHFTLACVRSLRDKLRALIACRLAHYRPRITPVEPATSLSATRTFDKFLSHAVPLRACSFHALHCPRHDLGAVAILPNFAYTLGQLVDAVGTVSLYAASEGLSMRWGEVQTSPGRSAAIRCGAEPPAGARKYEGEGGQEEGTYRGKGALCVKRRTRVQT
ncbi:hypothetical protein K523DRAFT_85932 [Schizophyllum commune Tattone D]|nr:hypothetical protein K523DRAFT_85932 [Schizophyllum commune Tattone D]